MAHETKRTQKPVLFSQSEIEAAKNLIQLSSGDSDEDHHSHSSSYSVVQGKPHHHAKPEFDSGGDVSSVAATEEEEEEIKVPSESEHESFARTHKRYRNIRDLYSVTSPLPAVKQKKKKMNSRKSR